MIGSICIVLALSAMPAAAQDTGAVPGTVVDTSSQVVPGATAFSCQTTSGGSREQRVKYLP